MQADSEKNEQNSKEQLGWLVEKLPEVESDGEKFLKERGENIVQLIVDSSHL